MTGLYRLLRGISKLCEKRSAVQNTVSLLIKDIKLCKFDAEFCGFEMANVWCVVVALL